MCDHTYFFSATFAHVFQKECSYFEVTTTYVSKSSNACVQVTAAPK